jgi:hypothetical protein
VTWLPANADISNDENVAARIPDAGESEMSPTVDEMTVPEELFSFNCRASTINVCEAGASSMSELFVLIAKASDPSIRPREGYTTTRLAAFATSATMNASTTEASTVDARVTDDTEDLRTSAGSEP